MYLMKNLVTIYTKSENLFLVNQIIKKTLEIFVIQIHFNRHSSSESILTEFRQVLPSIHSNEDAFLVLQKLKRMIHIENSSKLISFELDSLNNLDKIHSNHLTSNIVFTQEMIEFNKSLTPFMEFLGGSISSQKNPGTSLSFLLFVNSVVGSSVFVTHENTRLMRSQILLLFQKFRNDLHSDRVQNRLHMNTLYVETLYLSVLNMLLDDFDTLSCSTEFPMEAFVHEALEIYAFTENILYRRLFTKVILKQFWVCINSVLKCDMTSQVIPETSIKLFHCCLLLCKYNFLCVKTESLDLKEDIKLAIESLLGCNGVMSLRQILLAQQYDSHVSEINSDSEYADDDFDGFSDSR